MNFEKKVPEWNAEGSEPSESLKKSGFQGGYKPPAGIFNWFWHGVSACLTEIREKLSTHKHSASDIDSGTLPVERGGTGVTSSPSIRVNLSSWSADHVFKDNPRPGIEGVLPVENGGTGASNAETALAYLGAAAAKHNHTADAIIAGTLPVHRGGTGLTSSPQLRVNLGSTGKVSAFTEEPRPGVEGVLLVSNGGTGASDAATALNNLNAAHKFHSHSAGDIVGGAFTSRVSGHSASMDRLANAQFRDIYAGTEDLTAGTSALVSGTLYFVYE